jgi:D-xylose transport system ATP-binding protein
MSLPANPEPGGFVLEMRQIRKAFGGVQALSGADMSVRAGEIHALAGENGAGKSTLLKVLAGVYPIGSYDGQVIAEGRTCEFRSPRDAEHARIAVVHQELLLIPEMTVAENLFLGRETGSFGIVDQDGMEAEARRQLTRFGVADDIDAAAKVGDLGIGQKQVVEIVRALSRDAKILVLDEPTAALSTDEAERLLAWLGDLKRAGTTSIYVSHRMDEVFRICDRITVLRDGKTVGVFTLADVAPEVVVETMVGRKVDLDVRRQARPSQDSPVVLSVANLNLRKGPSKDAPIVLRDVSFDVRAGEIVCFAGAMGSGRTALLTTLFGCARGRVTGDVRIAGEAAVLDGPRAAIARGVALVPEDRKGLGAVLDQSVQTNLMLPQGASGWSEWRLVDLDAEEREAQGSIDGLRIRGVVAQAVSSLSGGNQQKVVLGKWLATHPRVLLLDEPTRGVDVGAREEIYAILEKLSEAGLAIVVASSDLQELLRLGNRIFVLRRGAVVAELDGRHTSADEISSHATGSAPGAPQSSAPPDLFRPDTAVELQPCLP